MNFRFFIVLAFICTASLPVSAEILKGKQADTDTRTVQEKRLSDLVCWQGGEKIIDEPGLRNFMFGQDMVYGDREDGSKVTILGVEGATETVCRIVEYQVDDPKP